MTSYIEYSDELLSIQSGIYEKYWDDGSPKTLGRYVNDSMTGYWEYYNLNGNLNEEGAYVNNNRVGLWRTYYYEGQIKTESNYKDGYLDGEQISYDSLGDVTEIEQYRMGELIEGGNIGDFTYNFESNDNPSEEVFKIVEKFPLFPGCPNRYNFTRKKECADKKFMNFLYSTLQYPADARQLGVIGSAKVSFVIEADGSITEVKVLSGLNQSITEELNRVIALMPAWIPGEQDGKKVRVQFNLPVNFNQ